MQVDSQPSVPQNPLCKICSSLSPDFAQATILNRYSIHYFKCSVCGFVQTEDPYWLDEAYSQAIAPSDVGLVSRNLQLSKITEQLILSSFNPNGKYLDYGCGYGLLVRLMRDLGLNFYGYDKYCQNIFYQGFEGNETTSYDLVTAFEVFEHFVDPIQDIQKILKFSKNLLLSTQLLPSHHPKPDEWWYYALHEGQHISIYTYQSLAKIAQKFNLNLYSNHSNLHLLTEANISESVWKKVVSIESSANVLKSLIEPDFIKAIETRKQILPVSPLLEQKTIKIIIDGVFFQIQTSGIARVWKSLLEEWSKGDFSQQIIVLDRQGTAPKIPGIQYYQIPLYDYNKVEKDRQLLQKICEQHNADLFISTYYTTPLTTPSVFMGYDMIPEQFGLDLTNPMWREKHYAIQHASAFITISENTAQDLIRFFPEIKRDKITVAHCGVPSVFVPATLEEIQQFKGKYGISKPYFLLVGQRLGAGGYKNTLLFFKALAQLKNNNAFEIVCVGGERSLELELQQYAQGFKINLLRLSDEELKIGYSGAIALVYPSKYEGFGMPIIEAMACGCPVITCRKGSIPEIAGSAAYYVDEDQVLEMVQAVEQIQNLEIRQSLIQAGLAQASQYSWSKMAVIIQKALMNTAQNLNSRLDFQDFTYSKRSHFNQFKRFGYYHKINLDACDLKVYQDLLAYNFINQNVPKGSKLLEIGGGNSRVLEALKQDYECWNLDKFEGLGNGPTRNLSSQGNRVVLDYIGNFNPQLPENYFDCVFSISTLEHITENEENFRNICQDIDRILKPEGLSLHCFDVVIKETEVWTNQFLNYVFKHKNPLNSFISFSQLREDQDLYGMSEESYRLFWQSITKQTYQQFGKPISYNILWKKSLKQISSKNSNLSPEVIVPSSLPKISLVTPCLNQGEFLEDCINSVLSQNYPNLEYIIMDGGSHDHSVEIIKKYEKHLTYWQSQPDGGHYLAVNAGLKKATGEIMGWLNSDDKYHPDAFYKVVAAFQQNQQIEWMMGIPTEWNRQGQQIPTSVPIPFWSRQLLLEKKGVKNNPRQQHIWIQQESTFWKRTLWEKAGSTLREDLKLAGDFELWLRFSRYAPLYLVKSLIGGFRTYESQRSKLYREQYYQEVEQIVQEELQLIQQGQYSTSLPAPSPIILKNSHILALKQQLKVLLKGEEKNQQKITIVTSIAPGNLEKQKIAVASWKQLGFAVVSLNSASEIEQLKSLYPEVTFENVNRDAQAEVGKPLIYLEDIFRYFQDHPSKLCAIVNSDIQLQTDENLASWLLDQAENAMIFGSRIEIETLEQRQGELYNKGFDFFFFDPKFLTDFPSSNFCLGLPWWDFWVPLIAWQRGWTLKRLVTPIAYHLKHSVNYLNENWQKYGIEFTKFFNTQLSDTLQQLKLTNPNQLQGQLIQIANQFLEQIHQKSISITYQNLSNLPIKTMDIQATPVKEQATLTRLSQSKWTFPTISPLGNNLNRPFWSVMIPTFNKVKYLEQTLRSVLEQAPGEDEMQIEVLNDCPDRTVQAELEAIVKNLGGNRVKFYRHSQQNIGQTAIFNLCLERAQGYWVHLLHDDDFVLPGFYQTLRNTIDQEPNLGAVFCRHYYVDGENNQRSVSALERETAGILENWLERIAVSQRIQPSSIVVKRSTYEQLGGFCPEAKSAADWEMWTRISAHYSIGYEPQILAAYRLHLSSWTSRLIQTGGNIADTRKSIEITQSYLPVNQAVELSNKAKEHYAFYALNTAKQRLNQGDATAAFAQIQEALNCSQSNAVKEAIIQLFIPQTPQLKTFTPTQILAETTRLVGEYRQQPNSDIIINELRKMRQIVAQYWLGLEVEKLEKIYLEEIGKAHQLILNSGIKNERLTPEEKTKVEEWKTYLDEGWHQPKALQHLFALMLYCYSYQLPVNWYVQSPIPTWFITDYFKYMLAVPQYFQELGEADRYYRYIQNWLDYTTGRFFSEPNFKLWQELAWLFTQTTNFIPLYFNTANLKNIYIKRSEMMTFALKNLGHQLDYQFSNRPDHRSKIRLGILSNHFSPQTETYSTLPVFEHLDRSQFEVILYAVQSNNHPLEQYCSSRVDRFVKLPKNLPDQVQLIRNDDLDILLIGSNVTAVTHSVTLLALHRLARIQVTSTSSCVTTGMPNLDCYISGTLTEPQHNAQEQYSEKLIKIEGTAHCFSYYSIPAEQPKLIPNRATLGLSDDAIVFISGANFYKIIPEVRETWAKILAAVPNSVLVLYPFNPNWTSQYAGIPFIKQFQATFAQYNVESQRLIFLQPQPSRADIKEYLKLADIYLDSYPFSGVNSLVDPLEVGLVPIAQDEDSIPFYSDYSSQSGQLFIVGDGSCFRSLMGASLLRSLSIPDLIANSEEAYIQLAVTLAQNPQLRQQKQQEIQHKMQQNPEFLDSRTYSAKMGQVFQQLFQTWQQEHQSWQLDSRETLQQYLSKLVSAVNAYDLDRNHQLVIAELIKIRRVLADYWLTIPPEHLEKMYESDLGKGYQILLNRGIQREPLTETEQYFLTKLTQQAIGLKQENALNYLMVCMLYYPPGRMLVQDAETRLPDWLIKDYKRVFETSEILEKVQPSVQVASTSIPVNNPTLITTEAFQNRLQGCVNLYRIDPTNSSVIEELRQIRKQMADFWLTVDASELSSIYQNSVKPLYQTFLKSGFSKQSLTESEQQFLNHLINQISLKLETPELMNFLLATLLYCQPGQMKIIDISRLPEWFREDYFKFNH